MKYTGPIYRPPIEANTLLLQVTVGCTHNKCSFCTMYKDIQFKVERIEQIERDLQEAKRIYGSLRRIFLVNADAFVLSARRLKEISKKIIEYFPDMEVITMYASIRNLMAKTNEELRELRDLRINDLWVGIETGHEDVLRSMNKGYTLQDTYEQLTRLNKAGIRHNGIPMIGAAGSGRGIENATATAKLINETKPQLIGVTSLGFFPGSKLSKDVEEKRFLPATELEILEEEKKLIQLINVKNMRSYGDHPINATRLVGVLPRDRKLLIQAIDSSIASSDAAFLQSSAKRLTL